MSAIRATCSEVIGLTHRGIPFCTVLQAYHTLPHPSVSQQVTPMLSYPLAAGVLALADPRLPPTQPGHSTPQVSRVTTHLIYQLTSAKTLHTFPTCYAAQSRELPTLHPSPPQASKPPCPRHSNSSRCGFCFTDRIVRSVVLITSFYVQRSSRLVNAGNLTVLDPLGLPVQT